MAADAGERLHCRLAHRNGDGWLNQSLPCIFNIQITSLTFHSLDLPAKSRLDATSGEYVSALLRSGRLTTGAKSVADRPNFLIIMSDQHHAGIMGCAGDEVIRTPNLDRIAARGVREELLAKVVSDWDGERVEREVTRKRKQYTPYLTRWGESAQLHHPEYWLGSNEMNRFTPPSGT